MKTKQLMMSKRKSDLKSLNEKKELDRQIEEEIVRLKKRLNEVHETYQKEVFLILEQILKLRQKQIKNYGVNALANERGINLSNHQIHYLFGYRFLSKFAHNQIDKGNLRLSTALYIVRQDLRYRIHDFQDKAIKMYLDGKLKTTEISRLSADIIFNRVNQGEEIDKANKQLINMSFSIQEYTKILKSKKNLFSDKKTLDYLKSQTNKFIELQQSLKVLFNRSKGFSEAISLIKVKDKIEHMENP